MVVEVGDLDAVFDPAGPVADVGCHERHPDRLVVGNDAEEPLELEKTRDIRTFKEIPIWRALQQQSRVRASFSSERWQAFKADWEAAYYLIDEMERRFGYREEAERLRTQLVAILSIRLPSK